jgi:hypothetical protein
MENINKSSQVIHHVKPLRGFDMGGYIFHFPIDMVSLTGNAPDSSTSRLVTPEGVSFG